MILVATKIYKANGRHVTESIRTEKLKNNTPDEQLTSETLNVVAFKGKRPSIVMLHGLGGTTRYWSSVMDFSKQEYDVQLIDLLGFGDSPKPFRRYTMEMHLQALEPMLEDKQDFIMVGHSLGAVIALAYAARFPQKVKRLVLIGMPYFDDISSARSWFRGRASGWIYTNYLAVILTCMFTRRIAVVFLPYLIKGYPREVVQDLVKHNVMSSTTSLWNVVYKHDPRLDCEQLPSSLDVYCIHSQDDDVAPVENLSRLATDYEWSLLRLNGYRHHVWLHNPKRCWRVICSGSI